MKTLINMRTLRLTLVALLSVGIMGCAATTRNIDPESDIHYDANYDFSDKKAIVDDLVGSLLTTTQINTSAGKPILITYGIANETSEHINTGGISDDIRLKLIQANKYRFLNREQRVNVNAETEYQQAGYVAVADQIKTGRQLGADYILAGTLRSIEKQQPRQWRLKKKKLVFYSMNLELTNLETGEISWADNVEIARESSQPIFRW
ncbi:MAG: penicillin-binding protein activator LpoB [Granulosicoccaceae bacterium]